MIRFRTPLFPALAGSILLAALTPPPGAAGTAAGGRIDIEPNEALQRALANEQRAQAAERDYSYRQEILVQVLGDHGSVRGQLHRVSEFAYDDLGNRVERIIAYPSSSLTAFLGILQPNFKTLLGVDPYFLTPEGAGRQTIRFVERQKLDDLNTLVFELEPKDQKNVSKENRPFKGRIWIDQQDLQMVKSEGVAFTIKDQPERFPKFEYYRENVEKGLWLPSVVLAKDTLDIKRYDLPIKIDIKYTGYRRIKSGR